MKTVMNVCTEGIEPPTDGALGEVIQEPTYPTRVKVQRYHKIKARLAVEPEVRPDTYQLANQADLMSLMKGVFLRRPEFLGKSTNQCLVELIHQVTEATNNSLPPEVYDVLAQIPFSLMLAAISVMRNHDGDVERTHPESYWERHHRVKAVPTPGGSEEDCAVNARALSQRRWCTWSRQIAGSVDGLNDFRDLHDIRVADKGVPAGNAVLMVREGRKNLPLTDAYLENVENYLDVEAAVR